MKNSIYEDFKKTLIAKMSVERDRIVSRNTLTAKYTNVFEISFDNEKLYGRILESLERLSVIEVDKLIYNLCLKHNINASINGHGCFDLKVVLNGKETWIDLKSNPNAFRDRLVMNRYVQSVLSNKENVVLVYLVRKTPYIDNIIELNNIPNLTIMTFEDLIKTLFGEDELKAFNKSMLTFKQEVHAVMGYQLVEVFNEENLKKLKSELITYFKTFDYQLIRRTTVREIQKIKEKEKEYFNDLYNYSFEDIVSSFLSKKRYEFLVGNNCYANSFLTSEWLFKQYSCVEELDNTFIVAGYLKSIEQLLYLIAFTKGKGRIIDSHGKEAVINEQYIDVTLGALEYFFGNRDNQDLFELDNSYFSYYLKQQLGLWRDRYRNGYFHQDSLKDIEKIKQIRNETTFLYCLILGSIKIDDELHQALI